MAIQITTSETKISVASPYNRDFATAAKALGGQWDAVAKAWAFDIRDEDRVRDLCQKCYGEDGRGVAETVTLRVKFPAGEVKRDSFRLLGHAIAGATSRDGGARLAEGVVLLEGRFRSGGSSQYWKTITDGATVLVRDFPKALADRLLGGEDPQPEGFYTQPTFSIEDERPVIDRPALEAEKVRLLARIDEINKLLNS